MGRIKWFIYGNRAHSTANGKNILRFFSSSIHRMTFSAFLFFCISRREHFYCVTIIVDSKAKCTDFLCISVRKLPQKVFCFNCFQVTGSSFERVFHYAEKAVGCLSLFEALCLFFPVVIRKWDLPSYSLSLAFTQLALWWNFRKPLFPSPFSISPPQLSREESRRSE